MVSVRSWKNSKRPSAPKKTPDMVDIGKSSPPLVIDVKEVQHILRSPDTIIEQSDVKKLTPVAERTLLSFSCAKGTLIERFLQEDPLKELLVDSEVKELFEQMQAAYEWKS